MAFKIWLEKETKYKDGEMKDIFFVLYKSDESLSFIVLASGSDEEKMRSYYAGAINKYKQPTLEILHETTFD